MSCVISLSYQHAVLQNKRKLNSPLAAFVSSLPPPPVSRTQFPMSTHWEELHMEAALVQSGGVKIHPKFERSNEQDVVSDMASRHFPDECVCVCGRGF